MKTLKFRAWNKAGRRMIDLHKVTPLALCIEFSKENVDCGVYIPKDKHIQVMQFTGLCDKDGREVYEGDILENGYVLGSTFHRRFVVEWNAKWTGYWMPVDYDSECAWSLGHVLEQDSDWKIIGNIYEDPQLLAN